MGKDRSKDGHATTSSTNNTALARTIAAAVAGLLAQQKSEETQSIATAVAGTLRQQNSEETQSIAKAVAGPFAKQKAEETQSITEAFTRQMEKMHAQYEELLKASHAQNFPSTLKVTSITDGFRVMDPFDWTMDKNIYQRWQLWSHKARLALEAMDGDTEKTKISYLHHWLNGDRISKIKDGRIAKLSSAKKTMKN